MKRIILTIIAISILSSGCSQNTKQIQSVTANLSQKYEHFVPKAESQLTYIDKMEKNCISKNYTTQEMNECIYKVNVAYEKEIDKYLLLLKSITSTKDFEKIQLSQTQWEAYIDSEVVLYNLIKQKQGTMFQNVAYNFQKELVKQRALELENLYKTLKTK